jgi:hypothetical protein
MPPLMAWGTSGRSAERPSGDPARLEAWCYTDRFSYRPLDRVDVHVHTTASGYNAGASQWVAGLIHQDWFVAHGRPLIGSGSGRSSAAWS